jgi:hypothetical protein
LKRHSFWSGKAEADRARQHHLAEAGQVDEFVLDHPASSVRASAS